MSSPMEENAALLDSRLRFPVHALPHERVVWAGTAAPRAFRGALLRIACLVALGLALVGALVTAPPLLALANLDECRTAVDAEANAKPVVYRDCSAAEIAERRTDLWRWLRHVFAGYVAAIAAAVALQAIGNLLRRRNLVYVATSERVVVQDGVLRLRLETIDLDHVVSITAEADLIDRWFGLKSIALTVPGQRSSTWHRVPLPNSIALWGIESTDPALSQLLNVWLPRSRG